MGCETAIFCGIWVQSFSISFFILTQMGHKKYFPDPTEKVKERRRENNVCGPKQIPGWGPMRAGRRPLNQRLCLEGAPIKQILKECFIHSTSRCYFVPSSGVIDFLHFTAVFGSLYSAFCCSALWCFRWFEILLNSAVTVSSHLSCYCFIDVIRGLTLCAGESVSCLTKWASEQTKWNLLWQIAKLFTI